jgi:hypothetical protein
MFPLSFASFLFGPVLPFQLAVPNSETVSLQQSPPREHNTLFAIKDIPGLLLKPLIHYLDQKNLVISVYPESVECSRCSVFIIYPHDWIR